MNSGCLRRSRIVHCSIVFSRAPCLSRLSQITDQEPKPHTRPLRIRLEKPPLLSDDLLRRSLTHKSRFVYSAGLFSPELYVILSLLIREVFFPPCHSRRMASHFRSSVSEVLPDDELDLTIWDSQEKEGLLMREVFYTSEK